MTAGLQSNSKPSNRSQIRFLSIRSKRMLRWPKFLWFGKADCRLCRWRKKSSIGFWNSLNTGEAGFQLSIGRLPGNLGRPPVHEGTEKRLDHRQQFPHISLLIQAVIFKEGICFALNY